jgi:hypothetical protein
VQQPLLRAFATACAPPRPADLETTAAPFGATPVPAEPAASDFLTRGEDDYR